MSRIHLKGEMIRAWLLVEGAIMPALVRKETLNIEDFSFMPSLVSDVCFEEVRGLIFMCWGRECASCKGIVEMSSSLR